MIENQIEKTMNSNNLRIYVGIPRLTSIDQKTIEIENNTCDWKTIEIEIKSEIEKQLRGFDMLTEFNADDKQCWAKTVLIENHVDGKTMEMIIHWEWKL